MRCPPALALPLSLALAAPAFAEEDRGAAKPADEAPSLDDLFGDTLSGGSSVKDLEAATQGLEKKSGGGLTVKTEISDPDARVGILGAFAAPRIVVSPTEGCIPADPERRKITFIELNQLPGPSPAFSTCLQLSSKAGRQMRLTASIVDARNRRVAKAEGIVDFTGRDRLDYVLDFPPVPFRMEGPHRIVVDLEGKEAGRMPIFDVKVAR